MTTRTDLALERREMLGERVPAGVRFNEIINGEIKTTVIEIVTPEGERALGKPKGKYITVEIERPTGELDKNSPALEALRESLCSLLPENGSVLVAGLGNEKITPDSLGPETVGRIFATRHFENETEKYALPKLRAVSAFSTGVMGQTGMESGEILLAITKKIKPDAVIVIDALAASNPKRIGNTVQLSNTGICPGSGVGNSRKRIDKETLGVPVIAVGVPTVSDSGETEDVSGSPLMITPRDIDRIIVDLSRLLGFSINLAVQKNLSFDELLSLA